MGRIQGGPWIRLLVRTRIGLELRKWSRKLAALGKLDP